MGGCGGSHAVCVTCAPKFCSAKVPATPPSPPSPPSAHSAPSSPEDVSPERSSSEQTLDGMDNRYGGDSFPSTPLRVRAPTCPFCRTEVQGFRSEQEVLILSI